jgi:hypothetical protein
MEPAKDVEESKRVAQMVDARRGHCFGACCDAVGWLPGCFYVEGWGIVLRTGEQFAHAWIAGNGRIIDPVIPEEPMTYAELRRWSYPEMHDAAMEKGLLPLSPELAKAAGLHE